MEKINLLHQNSKPLQKTLLRKCKKIIWRKISADHLYDKGLIYIIYKKLSKLNNEKRNNPIKKLLNDLNRGFTAEDRQVGNKTWQDVTFYWSVGKHRFKVPWDTPHAHQDSKHSDTRAHHPGLGRRLCYRKCIDQKQTYTLEPLYTAGEKMKCTATLETFWRFLTKLNTHF